MNPSGRIIPEPRPEIGDLFEEIALIAGSGDRGCRDAVIAAVFVCGAPMAEIASRVGLSRERVRQILKAHGLTSKDGGQRPRLEIEQQIRRRERERRRIDHRDRRCRQLYGCDYATMKTINGDVPPSDRSSRCYSYRQLRSNARGRGIEFSLSLPEWWGCWKSSGRWDKRDGPDRYGLTRIDYRKGYVPGNVRNCRSKEAAAAYQRQIMGRDEHAFLRSCKTAGT